jgi:hypothetical protein
MTADGGAVSSDAIGSRPGAFGREEWRRDGQDPRGPFSGYAEAIRRTPATTYPFLPKSKRGDVGRSSLFGGVLVLVLVLVLNLSLGLNRDSQGTHELAECDLTKHLRPSINLNVAPTLSLGNAAIQY